MATVILVGWRQGMQKIALAQLQRELLHLPLKETKENVDRVLEADMNELRFGRPVVLPVPDEVVHEFVARADALGALVGVVQMGVPAAPATITKQAA